MLPERCAAGVARALRCTWPARAFSIAFLPLTLLIVPAAARAQAVFVALPLPAVPGGPPSDDTRVVDKSQSADETDTWNPRLTTPGEAKVEEVSHWYGYETLAIDGAAILVTVLGIAADSSALAILGAAGYTFGPPILHGVHGSGERAIGSFALRIGLPNILGLVGYALEDCPEEPADSWDFDFCGFEGMFIGMAIGFPLAIAIDAAALSWEALERPAVVQPVVSVRGDGVVLGAVLRPAL